MLGYVSHICVCSSRNSVSEERLMSPAMPACLMGFPYEVGNPHDRWVIVLFIVIDIPIVTRISLHLNVIFICAVVCIPFVTPIVTYSY
jgi:hypothetical protein